MPFRAIYTSTTCSSLSIYIYIHVFSGEIEGGWSPLWTSPLALLSELPIHGGH